MVSLDDKDRAIIALLAKNARVTITSIARDLKISDVAVKKRIEKLERRGIILGYRIAVNPRALGYETVAIVGVNTEPGRVIEVADALAKRPDTTFVAVTSGDHEVLAEIWARDTKDMMAKIKEIESLSGVTNVYPAFIVDVVKHHTCIPEEFISRSSQTTKETEK
ncbi:MAG: Lrp/AsnC family transcriptional regulator [Desulfurococcaceae archaeon]|nr:Lrp/AsnC family transcriptional regulator [Desulfurococcaceae archaeon]